MKPKTRHELEMEGTLLHGVRVPEFFKARCDGCSAGRFKHLGIIAQLSSACYIHDWDITVIPIEVDIDNPSNKKRIKKLRKIADKRLFDNCRLIIGQRGKRPLRRFWLSRGVYLVVRLYGNRSIAPVSEKSERMPVTPDEFTAFVGAFKEGRGELSPWSNIALVNIHTKYRRST